MNTGRPSSGVIWRALSPRRSGVAVKMKYDARLPLSLKMLSRRKASCEILERWGEKKRGGRITNG